mgnify:CR=1 FL=1
MTFEQIVGAVARGWRDPKNQHKYMDVDLVIAIAKEVQKLSTSAQPAQKQQEIVHDPAEIRRVFEIDEADYPPPDSGFAKL